MGSRRLRGSEPKMGLVTVSGINPYSAVEVGGERNQDWFGVAVCRNDRSLFFASPGERPERRARREAKAKRICAACPVRIICRDTGREQREHGVWGGETESERAELGFLPQRGSRRLVVVDD